MARGKRHRGEDGVVVALIGDGAMTAGMAFEALNHAGHLQEEKLIVVLNDNAMSISRNVGAMSSYLSRKLSAPMVRRMKGWAKEFLGSLPGDMLHWARKAEDFHLARGQRHTYLRSRSRTESAPSLSGVVLDRGA